MSVAAAIRRMMAAGLTVEQALTAAEIAESELVAKDTMRSSGAERQARYRAAKAEREAASRVTSVTDVTSRDVTRDGRGDEARSPTPPKTQSPDTTPSPPKGGSVPKVRGTHLPDDWRPTDQHFAKAAERGVGRPWVIAQAEKMRDWAIANRNRAVARKADWDRTFSGWIDRELDKTTLPRGSPDRLTQADHRLNALHDFLGTSDDRDHYEGEIITPGSDASHGRSDRPLHVSDAGDVGAGRVRDFGRLRAVG